MYTARQHSVRTPVTVIASLTFPQADMHRRGQDVLIGDTHVGQSAPVFLLHQHRLADSRSDRGNQHRAALGAVHPHVHLNRWSAVDLSRSLDHVHLLIAAHPGYAAIVLDPYQQPATLSVGKRRQRPRNLPRVRYLELEILPDMLALRDT